MTKTDKLTVTLTDTASDTNTVINDNTLHCYCITNTGKAGKGLTV